MPRNKLVYGKRPKNPSTFASSTSFAWSSPQKPATTTIHPDKAVEVEVAEATEALEALQVGAEPKDSTRDVKKKNGALRVKDANAALKPALRHKDGKGKRAPMESPPTDISKDLQETDSHSASRDASRERQEARTTSSVKEKETTKHEVDRSESIRPHIPLHDPPPSSQMPECLPIRSQAPRTTNETLVAAPEHGLPTPPKSPVLPPSDPLLSYTQPLLHLCSDPAARTAPLSFSSWSDALQQHFNIVKIAEASYGEVYRLSLQAPTPGLTRSDESVLKIIALKPPPCPPASRAAEKKAALMSTISQVASEVQLLQRMTSIPGFTNFRDIRVLQGRPPPAFCTAWKSFNKSRRKSQKSIFPDPSRKSSYDDEQLWAVIEMQDAGTDLERLIEEGTEAIGGIWGVWDVFWGVVLALGKGEEGCRFEHRDLHLGNVCVRPTHAGSDSIISAPGIRRLDRNLGFTGLETTIIDYTLSRADMDAASPLSNGTASPQVAYLNLEADQALFEGDGELEYQYDIYRFMRAAMYLDEPLADLDARWGEAVQSGRTWEGYHPQTNLVWLHFILYQMLERVVWPSSGEASVLSRLGEGVDEVAAARKAGRIEKVLVRLQDLLDPGRLPASGLRSAKDLVGMALREGWLDEGDVIGSLEDVPVVAVKPKSRRKTARKTKGAQSTGAS